MLAIGRALMAKPKVLLLDEPSMGLAPMLVAQIFDIITEINRQGTTILLVEQNASQALQRAHRAYVLEVGQVLVSGLAKDLHDDPKRQGRLPRRRRRRARRPPRHPSRPDPNHRQPPNPWSLDAPHPRRFLAVLGAPSRCSSPPAATTTTTTTPTTTEARPSDAVAAPEGPRERGHAHGLLRHAVRALRVQGRRRHRHRLRHGPARGRSATRADLELAVIDLPFDGILGSLAAGDCDVVASAVTITDERAEQVDFSDPYFDSEQSLLVKAGRRGDHAASTTSTARPSACSPAPPARRTPTRTPRAPPITSFEDSDGLFAALESGDDRRASSRTCR